MLIAIDRWFSPGTPVSSTNKTDSHDLKFMIGLFFVIINELE